MATGLVTHLLRVLSSRLGGASGPRHRLTLSLVWLVRVHGRVKTSWLCRDHRSRPILDIVSPMVLIVSVSRVAHIGSQGHVCRPLHDFTDELSVRRGEMGRVIDIWQMLIRVTKA